MKTFLSWLTLPRLLALIVFIAIFTMAVRPPADTDTWWHLRSGQYIIENRLIPTTDPFSHTQTGQLWIDHSWLAQIFWYQLYAVGGWVLLALMLAALVTLAFWLTWRQIQGNIFIGAFSLILGAIVSSVVWAARPQMISFVLTAVVAYLLYRFKWRQGGLLPWLPLVMLLWVNLHGGFAIGFMLMLVYLAGETVNRLTRHQDDPVVSWSRLKYLLVVMLISLAVVAINPHTWRMWFYPFQTVGIGALRDFIQEWRSPDFHIPVTWPFVAMLLLTLTAMGVTSRQVDWTDLMLVGLWMVSSLLAARNIGLYGLLTAPVLARYGNAALGHYLPEGRSPSMRLSILAYFNGLLLGLVALAALLRINVTLASLSEVTLAENLPTQAVQFIETRQPAGPLFNSYNWGGYLIFKLWPQYPVYIDGRTDLYDDVFIRRYLNVMMAGDDWQKTLNQDGINLALIENDSILAKFLKNDPVWQEIYRDKLAVIFARKTALP